MNLPSTKVWTVFALAVLVTTPANADLIITEVVDGTLPAYGHPRYVELTNTGNGVVDLSQYSLGFYNAGQSSLETDISYLLDGSLGACESYVIAFELPYDPPLHSFVDVYGFEPDFYMEDGYGSFYFNGDDVVALFLGWPAYGDGTNLPMVDVYGVIGVSGYGADWDYTDSYAVRLTSTASPDFDPADWFIPGANTLEDLIGDTELQLLLDNTTPGTHECVPTAAEEVSSLRAAILHPNVPNPFNPATVLSFELAAPSPVSLEIFDLTGRRVRTLVQELRGAGSYEVIWRGRDDSGRQVASGVYVYKLHAGSYEETRRMTLLR